MKQPARGLGFWREWTVSVKSYRRFVSSFLPLIFLVRVHVILLTVLVGSTSTCALCCTTSTCTCTGAPAEIEKLLIILLVLGSTSYENVVPFRGGNGFPNQCAGTSVQVYSTA